VATIRIYADENVDLAIVAGLRRRGVEAWSAVDAGNLGLSDEEQLSYATRERAVLFTQDIDLIVIARNWAVRGKPPERGDLRTPRPAEHW